MSSYNNEIQLKDLLIRFSEYKLYLYKNKFIVILCTFFFLLIGVGISSVLKKTYDANLTFVVESEQGGGLGAFSGIASQFGFDGEV